MNQSRTPRRLRYFHPSVEIHVLDELPFEEGQFYKELRDDAIGMPLELLGKKYPELYWQVWYKAPPTTTKFVIRQQRHIKSAKGLKVCWITATWDYLVNNT